MVSGQHESLIWQQLNPRPCLSTEFSALLPVTELISTFSLLFFQPELLHRGIYTDGLHCLTSVHSVIYSESESCFTTPLKLLSVQHEGLHSLLGWPSPWLHLIPRFLRLSEQYFTRLATCTSLELSLLGLWFSPGCCFSYSLPTPPLINVYILWCLGTNPGFSFSSYHLSWRHFSSSMLSPNKSQQNSHIDVSFEFWTCLIPPLRFLICILQCNTSQTEIWTTPTSLPVLHLSKCHNHPPCFSSPQSESFYLQKVHRTIPLGNPSKYYFIMKCP